MTDIQHKTIIVVGAGPGIGLSVARRFAREGYDVGLVARDRGRLSALAQALREAGATVELEAADASVPAELSDALKSLVNRLGRADVVCFSPLPAIPLIKPVLDSTPEDLTASLALNVGGAAATVQAIVPAMIERASGTLLFTSGSGALRPSPERAASAITTAAESTYVALLHEALAPHGVHAGQVAIVGPVGAGEKHEPDAVAEALWDHHVRRDAPLTVLE